MIGVLVLFWLNNFIEVPLEGLGIERHHYNVNSRTLFSVKGYNGQMCHVQQGIDLSRVETCVGMGMGASLGMVLLRFRICLKTNIPRLIFILTMMQSGEPQTQLCPGG